MEDANNSKTYLIFEFIDLDNETIPRKPIDIMSLYIVAKQFFPLGILNKED
jgi:hypothetical protein|tara:strand:+ start:227 stop:379 length:153 start_codon:yes stop_codon:yes gene_type:complete